MPKVGFLLGAGASFPFGIPMMREFYNGFKTYIEGNRAHCLPLIEKIESEASTTPDLEFLIERIEKVRSIRSGLDVLGESTENVDEQLELAEELRGYLDMYLIETCERFDLDKVERKLTKFVKFAHARDAFIFTTNYDRLIEVAASSIGLECSDGFEAASTRPESRWNGKFDSGVRLIKLHGSVNWYEEEGSETLYRLERGYSLPSYQYRLTHGARALRPLMIIPTLEKSVLKHPYFGLLTQFSDGLKEIDTLVIIGNSLRDVHLLSTIAERVSNLNILLVNPAADDQLDSVGSTGAAHAVLLGIEEFIEVGLDTFGQLLDEVEQITALEDRRSRFASFAQDLTTIANNIHGMSEEARASLDRLKSDSIDTRLTTLKALTRPVHPAIIAEVQRLAINPGDDMVRVAAIDALAESEGIDAAGIFVQILRRNGPLAVQAEAALALKAIGGEAILSELNFNSDEDIIDPTIASLFSKFVAPKTKIKTD